MQIPISLPLDVDGYLRRACSECGREFKWHQGPVGGAADTSEPVAEYFCPYCGQGAALDQWLTKDQVEYMHDAAVAAFLPVIRDELQAVTEGLTRDGFISVEVRGDESVTPPSSLQDPDDLRLTVASPCHPYEPVKIAEDWQQEPVHCLVCGAAYSLPNI